MGLLLRPTNRHVRILVGLLLAGLFAIQCTRTEAFKESAGVVAVDGKAVGKTPTDSLSTIDRLAKSDHIALLEMCLKNYQANYYDYTCTFTKQEVIQGAARAQQEMAVKFMGKPFSVAMAWQKNPPAGDRMVYVEGRYNNQMLVRPTSALARMVVPSALRAPDDSEAMKVTLRPVNMFGFERSLGSLLDIYRIAKKSGELREEFGDYAQVNGRKTVVLVRYLPDKPCYVTAACKTVIFIDTDYLVPLRIEGYDAAGKPTSVYNFSAVKFNVGLTKADFTPEANEIKPPQ